MKAAGRCQLAGGNRRCLALRRSLAFFATRCDRYGSRQTTSRWYFFAGDAREHWRRRLFHTGVGLNRPSRFPDTAGLLGDAHRVLERPPDLGGLAVAVPE